VNEKSDSFFAGMAWSTLILGYYSLALELARMPIEKLIGLIFQITFPVFSKLQEDKEQIVNAYLKIIKIIATLIFPIYVGGFLLGDELVRVILGEKWSEMTFVFRWLCLSQIMISLSTVNGQIHLATGKPKLNLYYNILLAVSMAISFYFAVGYGLNWIVLPWLVTSNFLSAVWIVFTIRKINISLYNYIKNLFPQLIATLSMAGLIYLFDSLALTLITLKIFPVMKLIILIAIGSFTYLSILLLIDSSLLTDLKKLNKARTVPITA
jgi:O-antigen/teichoic acid export membrane protein